MRTYAVGDGACNCLHINFIFVWASVCVVSNVLVEVVYTIMFVYLSVYVFMCVFVLRHFEV